MGWENTDQVRKMKKVCSIRIQSWDHTVGAQRPEADHSFNYKLIAAGTQGQCLLQAPGQRTDVTVVTVIIS